MYRVAVLMVALALVALLGFQTTVQADHHEEAESKPVTVSGTSGCAQCEGVAQGHNVYLTLDSGIKIVLMGDDESYQDAFKVRKNAVKMTAVLEGPIKSAGSGDSAYLVANAASIKVEG